MPTQNEMLLLQAAKTGDLEIVTTALKAEVDPNVFILRERRDGGRMSHDMIKKDNERRETLPELFIDYTPLLIAAKNGHTRVLNALIEANADINMADIDGYTPLMYAVINENFDCIRALVAAGAKTGIQTNDFENVYKLAENHRVTNALELLNTLVSEKYKTRDALKHGFDMPASGAAILHAQSLSKEQTGESDNANLARGIKNALRK